MGAARAPEDLLSPCNRSNNTAYAVIQHVPLSLFSLCLQISPLFLAFPLTLLRLCDNTSFCQNVQIRAKQVDRDGSESHGCKFGLCLGYIREECNHMLLMTPLVFFFFS